MFTVLSGTPAAVIICTCAESVKLDRCNRKCRGDRGSQRVNYPIYYYPNPDFVRSYVALLHTVRLNTRVRG